jgi:hypothetical protein
MLTPEEQTACEHILREMTAHIDRFITPISEILDDEHGRAAGSGTYLQINNTTYLLTNEHVAVKMLNRGIAHLPRRDDLYRRIVQPMTVINFPVDLAVSRVGSESWEGATQFPLSVDRLDESYSPVDGELLFVCGYPGYARPAIAEGEIRYPRETRFGLLSTPAVPILTYPVRDVSRFPDGLDETLHATVHYHGVAHRPGEGMREVPDPRGFSGSLLWDTKFGATNADNWTPAMSKVCGLIHRWDSDHEVLIVTKVEFVRATLLAAVRREAAFFNWIDRGRPLWEELVDWAWAEQAIPRLTP